MSKSPEAVKPVEPKKTSEQVIDATKAPELKLLEGKTPQLSIEAKQPDIEQAMNDLNEMLAKSKVEKNELANDIVNKAREGLEAFAYLSNNLEKLNGPQKDQYEKLVQDTRKLYADTIKQETGIETIA